MAKRVYFAFHYQDVIDFRANVVRKHNFTGGVKSAGYYDASIWEKSKKKGDLALKRMINSELEYTSVTAVLIGSNTWARRWVRYEIMKSIEIGNKVIGIHINGIKDRYQCTKPLGPNPFDNLALEINDDGTRAKPIELQNKQWIYYDDLNSFSIHQEPWQNCGKQLLLSHWLRVYDWDAGDGFNNFNKWIS
ncbi:hypothetical protein FACS1894108_14920 [Planctomycetales bacterium]|nr:hypothetical protein FACS1894108_14920 [Planctomycetales bacterium]